MATGDYHLQADFPAPFYNPVWRGRYEAEWCLADDYPNFTTASGSPTTGDTFRVRFMATGSGTDPLTYYARIRTVDLDGTLGDWIEAGPHTLGTDVPPGGSTGGMGSSPDYIAKDDLRLSIGPPPFTGPPYWDTTNGV